MHLRTFGLLCVSRSSFFSFNNEHIVPTAMVRAAISLLSFYICTIFSFAIPFLYANKRGMNYKALLPIVFLIVNQRRSPGLQI